MWSGIIRRDFSFIYMSNDKGGNMKRKVYFVFLLTACLTTGCTSKILEEKILKESEIDKDENYIEYQELSTNNQLDESGFYYEEEVIEEKPGSIRVCFGENSNLDINYYKDSNHTDEIDISDCYMNPGESIYFDINVSSSAKSTEYSFSKFDICNYTEENKYNVIDVLEANKEINVSDDSKEITDTCIDKYTIPNDCKETALFLMPKGEYKPRKITLKDYIINENNVREEIQGEWSVNNIKVDTEDSVEINSLNSYIISYKYDSNEYFYVNSEPECFYFNNDDGEVIFKMKDPSDETTDYSVYLRGYSKVKIVSDKDRIVKKNDGEETEVKLNNEYTIDKLMYGQKLVIETDSEWPALENNRELILLSCEKSEYDELLGFNGEIKYKYTLEVPDKREHFDFNPLDYKVIEHGELEFICFGETVKGREELYKNTRIYYKVKNVDDGYWLPGKDEEHYIIVGDAENTKKALKDIHFTKKTCVNVVLPQPEYGGSLKYCIGNEEIKKGEYQAYSGDEINIKADAWEGWISEIVDEASYVVTENNNQVITVNQKDINDVFTEDKGHMPELSVYLEKTCDKNMSISLSASGYSINDFHYDGRWKLGKKEKYVPFSDNVQIMCEKTKIGTEKGISLVLKNRAVPSGKAIRIVVKKTDTSGKDYISKNYVNDLSKSIDTIPIYTKSEIENSPIWYKSISISIGEVEVMNFSKPYCDYDKGSVNVKNAENDYLYKDGDLIEGNQEVYVEIIPSEGHSVKGKKVENGTYSEKMKYSEYKKKMTTFFISHIE